MQQLILNIQQFFVDFTNFAAQIVDQMPIVIPALNTGFLQTLRLFFVTLLGALPLGLVISFGSMNKWTLKLGKLQFRPIRCLFQLIVWIFRGSPLMLQLMIIFYVPGM